jgi:hypothetical protein
MNIFGRITVGNSIKNILDYVEDLHLASHKVENVQNRTDRLEWKVRHLSGKNVTVNYH